MKAFVTGATGFVGSHLVEALLKRGDQVTCLVRDAAKAARVFQNHEFQTVLGTLDDEATLHEGCKQADVVFHVAGLTAARSREEFFAVNAEATRRLTAVAARAAPNLSRFVYVSSLAAAGPSTHGHPITEATLPRPVSVYGDSKLAGEDAVRDARIPWTIVRPPLVYGPRDREVVRLFRLARWGVAPVFGDVEQELSILHVRDLAAALLRATAPIAEGKTYFVSHPEIATSTHLAEAIYQAVQHVRGRVGKGRRKPRIVRVPAWITRAALVVTGTAARLTGRATLLSPDKGNDLLAEAWTCTPTALMRDTGWTPDISLTTGLEETARWYREHDWL